MNAISPDPSYSSSRKSTPLLSRRELTPEQASGSSPKLGTHYQAGSHNFLVTNLQPRRISSPRELPSLPSTPVDARSSPKVKRVHHFTGDISPDFRKKIGNNNELSDESPWEVDIKYITYDPIVGNVIDDAGPVYMYTAHQMIPQPHYYYGSCCGDTDDEDKEVNFIQFAKNGRRSRLS
ncbi:hypothetical protein Ciccas_011037 [Cichlidogyrus casuarinus]|uniref:Uncharacterized protein n=1 Tax=Cichlidogyrus casuarinus TaxID=1844966 RepID=A0ABD2PSF3_9PLAT